MNQSEARPKAAQQLHDVLSKACQAHGGNRFQLMQVETDTILVIHSQRFLAFRLTPPPEPGRTTWNSAIRAAGLNFRPAFDVGLELSAGCTTDGRLPPEDYYRGTEHRFLAIQGRFQRKELLWTYRCPRHFINAMPSARRQDKVDLTTEQLTTACFRLLAMAPTCPPERLTVARTMFSA
jgi:hypothetical protein